MASAGAGACLFCSIVAGETPAVIVHETPDVLAFLDHRPLFPGHTLVVPRRHVVTVETRAFNQRGEEVCYFRRKVMVPKREAVKPRERPYTSPNQG